MKPLDHLLQRWRIGQAARFIPAGARVLDLGCHEGKLFESLGSRVAGGVGIDPLAPPGSPRPGVELIRGRFPDDLPSGDSFEVITALAVFEHVPSKEQSTFLRACHRVLVPQGRLILTVPSPRVDALLVVLKAMRLVQGMSLEEHHGFDPAATVTIAQAANFGLLVHHRFQLGLNHLFVFRPAG